MSASNPPFGSDTPPQLSAIPTYTDPSSQKLVKFQFKDVSSVVAAYQSYFQADLWSSRQRARNQQMIDGVPPYSEARDKVRGLGGRSNVNWGLATTAQEEAEGPYADVLDAIGDEFCTLPTSWGDEQVRIQWEAIMAEEFSVVLRNWPQFTNLWLYNARIFVAEGLSFVFFPDDKDWRWLPYSLQHFKFPRRSRADINELDTICCKVNMLPYQLQQHVENEQVALEEGWNKQEVYEAIKTAAQHGLPSNDVEEWEKAWKNNDYYQGMTNLTVETVFCWARESDGTISHYIARYDSGGDFLYKREGQKRDMESMMVAYQYGVGTNGDFHSIRGHAQKTYATSSAYNRLLNKALDMLVHVSTPHVRLTNEDTNNSIPLQPLGPYIGLEPGADFVEIKVPDFTQSLYPGLQLMQGLFQTKTRAFLPNPGAATDKTERTKYEMQMRGEQQGSLSTAGLNLFFDAWKRHLKQVVRRFIRQDYEESEAGGREVWKFRNRCFKRGVPLEAIYNIDIDRIEVNTGLGKGSAIERKINLDRLNGELYYRLDPTGQRILDRMVAAEYGGSRLARLLVPTEPGLRPPIDVQIANLENNQIVQGMQVPVEPNQNHAAHIQVHLGELGTLYTALGNFQLPLEQAIPQMYPLWQHTGQHLQMLDPQNPMLKPWKQTLEVMGEVIVNGQKHLDAQAQKAQRQQAKLQQSGQAPAGPAQPGAQDQTQTLSTQGSTGGEFEQMPSSVYREAVKAQTMLGFLQQKQAMELQHAQDKHQQQLAFEDAKTAQTLRNQQLTQ